MTFLTKLIGDKRQWREYRARIKALPTEYRTAVDGIQRYLFHTGPGNEKYLLEMLDDLADLFERAAADHTSIAAIVGEDPVEFAEEFKRNYGHAHWLAKEQQLLRDTIAQATQQESS